MNNYTPDDIEYLNRLTHRIAEAHVLLTVCLKRDQMKLAEFWLREMETAAEQLEIRAKQDAQSKTQ